MSASSRGFRDTTFRRRVDANPRKHEKICVSLSVFRFKLSKMSQKVERLTKVATMMQSPGHGRKVFQPRLNMLRSFLEYRAPFVLGQRPPLGRFLDRNQR